MPNSELDQRINSLVEKIEKSQPVLHKDETRRRFALYFLIGYFALLVFILIFIFVYNKWVIVAALKKNIPGILPNQLLDLERILFLMTSAFGSTLGFIIGYYFKDDK